MLRALLCAAFLLAPTVLMGATLPCAARSVESTPQGVYWLGIQNTRMCDSLMQNEPGRRRKLRHRVKGGMQTALGVLAVLLVSHVLLWPISLVRAEESFDPEIRAALLKRKSGLIAHVETAYNDIFVSKDRNLLKLSFEWKGWHFQESQVNLADPDDLPMLYSRTMTIAAIYPQDVKRVLMLGLGGGGILTYLSRFLPDAMFELGRARPWRDRRCQEIFRTSRNEQVAPNRRRWPSVLETP